MGATTQLGAPITQLPELLLEAAELDEELDDELVALLELEELEVLELPATLDELELLDEPPPQPATVSAPSAPNACRRLK